MKYAEDKFNENFAESCIEDNIDSYPLLTRDQLRLGKILGKGCFGTVCEVRKVNVDKDCNAKSEIKFISDHCIREDSGDARYAVKMLNPEIVKDSGTLIQGCIDMAVETRILSATEHPNIMKARGWARGTPFTDEYFILMDRLYDTMLTRIEKWMKKAKKMTGIGGKLYDRKGTKKLKLWEDRLVAVYDLSDALGYLHRKNIVYRDLKPENVGFDIRDDVKLFDFGLSVEKRESRRDTDGLYKLTGMTGSPRYMAPEVANEKHYNEKCDVYSFAILLWEILALRVPFEVYTMSKLMKQVWNGEHKRPYINPAWPEAIRMTLEQSWSDVMHIRPGFTEVTEVLRQQLVFARGGSVEGLGHSRRRSTFVFERSSLSSALSSMSSFMSTAAMKVSKRRLSLAKQ